MEDNTRFFASLLRARRMTKTKSDRNFVDRVTRGSLGTSPFIVIPRFRLSEPRNLVIVLIFMTIDEHQTASEKYTCKFDQQDDNLFTRNLAFNTPVRIQFSLRTKIIR